LFLSANIEKELPGALLQPSYRPHAVSLLIAPKMPLYRVPPAACVGVAHRPAVQAFSVLPEEAVFCPTKHLLLPVT